MAVGRFNRPRGAALFRIKDDVEPFGGAILKGEFITATEVTGMVQLKAPLKPVKWTYKMSDVEPHHAGAKIADRAAIEAAVCKLWLAEEALRKANAAVLAASLDLGALTGLKVGMRIEAENGRMIQIETIEAELEFHPTDDNTLFLVAKGRGQPLTARGKASAREYHVAWRKAYHEVRIDRRVIKAMMKEAA